MKRMRLNLLALAVITLGSWHLTLPGPVLAQDGEACCDGIKSDCCGDRCRVDSAGWCSECNGFWDCLFF